MSRCNNSDRWEEEGFWGGVGISLQRGGRECNRSLHPKQGYSDLSPYFQTMKYCMISPYSAISPGSTEQPMADNRGGDEDKRIKQIKGGRGSGTGYTHALAYWQTHTGPSR